MSLHIRRLILGLLFVLAMLVLVTGIGITTQSPSASASAPTSPQLPQATGGKSGSNAADPNYVSAPMVSREVKHDTSIPLRDMKVVQGDPYKQIGDRDELAMPT